MELCNRSHFFSHRKNRAIGAKAGGVKRTGQAKLAERGKSEADRGTAPLDSATLRKSGARVCDPQRPCSPPCARSPKPPPTQAARMPCLVVSHRHPKRLAHLLSIWWCHSDAISSHCIPLSEQFASMPLRTKQLQSRSSRVKHLLHVMRHRLRSMRKWLLCHFDPANFRNCLLMVGNCPFIRRKWPLMLGNCLPIRRNWLLMLRKCLLMGRNRPFMQRNHSLIAGNCLLMRRNRCFMGGKQVPMTANRRHMDFLEQA